MKFYPSKSLHIDKKKNDKWFNIHNKRERIHNKINKLERSCNWSKEARESFQKFNIEGIEESGLAARVFRYKNKIIRIRSRCKKCGTGYPNKSDYVDKVLTNGDEVWRCGTCKYLHQDPGNIFEYDNPPDSPLHTYFIIQKSDINNVDLDNMSTNN
mgnify:CR=1 FL=1